MKTTFLLFSLLLIGNLAFAQWHLTDWDPGMDSSVAIQKMYWDNGNLRLENVIEDDKLIRLQYHAEGGLHIKAEIHHGFFSDTVITFSPDTYEEAIEIINWHGDVPRGKYIEFFADGVIARKGKLNSFGKMGEWKEFYPNGNVKELKQYTKIGMLDGLAKSFYPNGLLKTAGAYVIGLTEHQTEYLVTTNSEGKFIPDQSPKEYQTGRWKYYSENGQLAADVNYNSTGMKEGKSKTYYNNGNIKSVGKYKVITEMQEEIKYSPTTYEKITVKKMTPIEKKTGKWKHYSEQGLKKITHHK